MQKPTWIGTTILRTDRPNIVKLHCLACRRVMGIVEDKRFAELIVWDSRILFDMERSKVTIKCHCGSIKVVSKLANHEDGSREDLGVWLQEINDESFGEHEDIDEGKCQPD